MKFHTKNHLDRIKILLKHKATIFFIVLFFLHLFLRFYAIETKSGFGWDQVDSAWAAKGILIDHKYPLVGPENKLGSGVFIGPLYYYIVAVFYFITNMDPIAAGWLAGVSSIIGFFVLFLVTKKMFPTRVALIALYINTLSFFSIEFERVQWEVNFIPALSLLAFYFLYKILSGNDKSIVHLAIIFALVFHTHLTTAVFIPIIILITLPFFPKTKKTLQYLILSIPVVFLGLAPIVIYNIKTGNSQMTDSLGYANSSFHGIHLVRIKQLLTTAFIQLESFFPFSISKPLSLLWLPAFFATYFLYTPTRKRLIIVALVILWFIVPWIVLSTYNGEITHYYFSINRYIGLVAIAYVIYTILKFKNKVVISLIIILACLYGYLGIHKFLTSRTTGLQNSRAYVKDVIKNDKVIQFEQGNQFSYLYYFYKQKNDHDLR